MIEEMGWMDIAGCRTLGLSGRTEPERVKLFKTQGYKIIVLKVLCTLQTISGFVPAKSD